MYRVIVADDEKLARDRICRYLGQMIDVEVVASVWNGQLVKEYMEQNMVDAVISDIRMPSMDGIEVANWVHEYYPECHVILISVYEDFAYAKKAIESGVKAYLVKPIRSEELINAVKKLIHERNEFEKKNLYLQNMQSNNGKRMVMDWNKNQESIVTEEFSNMRGSLFVFEDNRNYIGNRELLPIAFTNIIQWSAPKCGCVFIGKKGWSYLFILLFENIAYIPEPELLEERAVRLLDTEFRASRVGEFSKPEQLYFLTDNMDDKRDGALEHIKRYIMEHVRDEISRDDVAAIACMTPAYFSRYFKAKTGLSYQDYIQKIRMEEAQKMLRKGMSVKEASAKVGYSDRNYFNRTFKKYTGYTPAEYRKIYE